MTFQGLGSGKTASHLRLAVSENNSNMILNLFVQLGFVDLTSQLLGADSSSAVKLFVQDRLGLLTIQLVEVSPHQMLTTQPTSIVIPVQYPQLVAEEIEAWARQNMFNTLRDRYGDDYVMRLPHAFACSIRLTPSYF